MKNIISCITVFVSVLIAASFLSGAGVMFAKTWYPAPARLSEFVIMLATFVFFTATGLRVVKWLCKN